MSEGIFDPSVQLNEMMEVVSDSTISEVTKVIPEVSLPEVAKAIPEVSLPEVSLPEVSLPENDISSIGDVFDGFNITNIEENKEYFIVGLLILCVIGYYTYNNIIQMNDSLNDGISDTINIEDDETKKDETTKEKKD